MRALLILLLLGSTDSSALRAQSAPDLAGTWRLVSMESRDDAGGVSYPMGEGAQGLLMYDGAGNMTVHLMRPDRAPFASGDIRRGTDAEVRTAFDGYVGYYGTYALDPATQTVTHHLRGASFPNWIGSDQVRAYRLDGERLTLGTPPIDIGGRKLTSVLVWERVRGGSGAARQDAEREPRQPFTRR